MGARCIVTKQSSTLCLKNSSPFLFFLIIWSNQMLTDFKFDNVAAEKIFNLMTYFFLIISSLCMNIT